MARAIQDQRAGPWSNPEGEDAPASPPPAVTFASVYEQHFAFVFRSVRRLGIADALLDDVVQDVFVVVHLRLPGFEGNSSLRTWLFGIVLRVVSGYRRTAGRHGGVHAPLGEVVDDLPDKAPSPLEAAVRGEANVFLHGFLDQLDQDKRAVFIMVELEQMSVPEAAQALGANLDTVYSRLRVARQKFEQAIVRYRARDVKATP